jgi:hypothetical protein
VMAIRAAVQVPPAVLPEDLIGRRFRLAQCRLL